LVHVIYSRVSGQCSYTIHGIKPVTGSLNTITTYNNNHILVVKISLLSH